MSTTSTNLGLTLAEGTDVVDVDAHIASNFSTLDSKWSSGGNPAAVEVGSSGTPGASTVVSRSDHVHGITTGTPSSVGTTNSAGSNTTVAASDHIHKLGDDSVPTAAIQASAVTTAKIADSNVTTAKIADSNVTTAKIADLNVTTGKLNDLAVTTGKLNDLAVTTAKIADANVTTVKIADSNVTTAKILDSNVTTAKIADANVTRAKLEAIERTPIGAIQMYGGSSAPTSAGWLLCDGSAVSRTTYASLFTVIGTAFGSGDGGSTFNLPDLRDRFPIGDSASLTLGATGGASTVNLQHAHAGSTAGASSATGGNPYDEDESGNGHTTVESNHGHNISLSIANSLSTSQSILPPYQVVNFIIYSGVAS